MKKKRRISNFTEIVNEIKEHDIIELKFMFPELAKGKFLGKLYFINCPFHKETTDSLCIFDKTNGGFICYGGCGMRGSIIDYYMGRKELNFIDAVIDLCKIFKIKIRWENID